MGLLVNGNWTDQWYDSKDGSFQRSEAAFRNWIGDEHHPAESGRYIIFMFRMLALGHIGHSSFAP